MLGVGVEVLGHLRGQFARRAEDQATGHAGPRPSARKAMDHREHEGRRLAGAGLRDACDVAAGEDMGDGFGLDRRGRGIACLFHSLKYVRPKAEVCKCYVSQCYGSWNGF